MKHSSPVPLLVTELVVRETPTVEPMPAMGGSLRTPRRVADLMAPMLAALPVEEFWGIALDGRHRAAAAFRVSTGTLTSSIVHPREVFGPALRWPCAAVIVVHNHPSGDPEPSPEDLAVTRRLRAAGKILGIPLLDHVVIGGAPGGPPWKWISINERTPKEEN